MNAHAGRFMNNVKQYTIIVVQILVRCTAKLLSKPRFYKLACKFEDSLSELITLIRGQNFLSILESCTGKRPQGKGISHTKRSNLVVSL